jgi:hypothetical protein
LNAISARKENEMIEGIRLLRSDPRSLFGRGLASVMVMLVVLTGSSAGLTKEASATQPSTVTKGTERVIASATASSLMAGYYAAPIYGLASGSATFVVPAVRCASHEVAYQQIGLFDIDPTDIYSYKGLQASIEETCKGNTDQYGVLVTENDQGTDLDGVLKAGDTIVTTMWQTGSLEFAQVHDLTNNRSWDASGDTASDTQISFGIFPDGQDVGPFGKVTFSDVQINGNYLTFESASAYNLVSGSKTIIATSSIAKPGDAFSLTYKD